MLWPQIALLAVMISNPLISAGDNKHLEHKPLVTTDVLIDAGHGGSDSGTKFGDLLEKQINLQMAHLLFQQLTQEGFHVVMNRTGDYALSDENGWLKNRSRHIRDLAQRKELAQQLNPKVMISLHVNWSKSNKKSGPIILFQTKEPMKEPSLRLAQQLQHSLNELYGSKEKPIPGKTFYLLKYTHCPTVIVEMGFISNRNDRNRLTDPKGQKEIVMHMTTALKHYLDQEKKITGEAVRVPESKAARQ